MKCNACARGWHEDCEGCGCGCNAPSAPGGQTPATLPPEVWKRASDARR
jgi:hypothetical protein